MAIHAAYPHLRLKQSDCIRAYTQAALPKDGPETWIRLPKKWWPAHFFRNPKTGLPYKDPVFPLRVALYGHPRAGDLWHDMLCGVLLEMGCVAVEGWPSVYVAFEGDEFVAIVVYVDDVLILGGDYARSIDRAGQDQD